MAEPAPPQARCEPAAAPSWDDIGVFHAVVGAGSLALAAARLRLSEATVARRVRALEAALGLPLFIRAANRLVLTEPGAALAREAAAMAEGAERLLLRARAARPAAADPVKVTATTSISLLLTKHATALSADAGHAEIVIISTRDQLDLARGEADIALRMRKAPEAPGHFAQRVGRLAQALYVRRDVDPLTAPVISVSRETSSRIDEHIAAFANGRAISARVGDSAARYESVRSAGAVSMVPCFIGDTDPALRRLAPPPEATADAIYLVSHEISRHRPAVAAVLAALRRLFRRQRRALAGEEGDPPA